MNIQNYFGLVLRLHSELRVKVSVKPGNEDSHSFTASGHT